MHGRIRELIEPGLPKNELVAEIYRTGSSGADGHGGDYPAIVPLLPSGADASAPHLTWDDKPIPNDSGTFFEIAGVYKRYHCPLSRSVLMHLPLDVVKAFRRNDGLVLPLMNLALVADTPGIDRVGQEMVDMSTPKEIAS